MSVDFSGRVSRLQNLMSENEVDVSLFSVGADLPYFTGYETMPSERLTVMVIPVAGSPVLYVPLLEAPGVPSGDFEVRAWTELEDPVELAAATTNAPARVAVGDHMWAVFLTRFQRIWTGRPGARPRRSRHRCDFERTTSRSNCSALRRTRSIG